MLKAKSKVNYIVMCIDDKEMLEPCLESILAQKTNSEISVVINGLSSDGSYYYMKSLLDEITEYAPRYVCGSYQNVSTKVVHADKKNEMLLVQLGLSVQTSSPDYWCVMRTPSILAPDKISKCIELQQKTKAACVYSDFIDDGIYMACNSINYQPLRNIDFSPVFTDIIRTVNHEEHVDVADFINKLSINNLSYHIAEGLSQIKWIESASNPKKIMLTQDLL